MVLGFLLIGWKTGARFLKPVTKRSNQSHATSSDSHLKIALMIKKIVTPNGSAADIFSRSFTGTTGSNIAYSSYAEAKIRPSGKVQGQWRRIRIGDVVDDVKDSRIVVGFLFH